MRTRKAVGAVIKIADKYLLVNKIKNHDVNIKIQEGGEWDFVKGGVKAGESFEEALLRELYEELGCENFKIIRQFDSPLSFQFQGTQKNKNYDNQITYFYLVEFVGEIKNINLDKGELAGIELLNNSEIVQRLTHDDTKEYFIRHIMEDKL